MNKEIGNRITFSKPDTGSTRIANMGIDRTVSFVIELIDDTKSTFEEAIGLATYSNNKSTVLSYVSIFESLWKLKVLYERLQKNKKIQEEFIDTAAHT